MDISTGSKPVSYKTPSPTGILLIHGYTSTPSSLYYLAEQFKKKKYNIELPLLSGHGTKWQDLNTVTCQDWCRDIENALKKLKKRCKKIHVLGLSMGGLLALYLAVQHPELKSIIIINHALILKDWRLFFLPLLRLILPATKAVAADLKDPEADEIAYEYTPTNGVYEIVKLQKYVKKNLSVIKQPVLIIKSREDHLIPRINVLYTFKRISSTVKEIIWLDNSYHVATLDYDKDKIVQLSLAFIKKNS